MAHLFQYIIQNIAYHTAFQEYNININLVFMTRSLGDVYIFNKINRLVNGFRVGHPSTTFISRVKFISIRSHQSSECVL